MVLFAVLILFMADTRPHHGGISVDMPKVTHPVSMRGVERDDAMTVVVTRNGHVFFRNEQISVDGLPVKLGDHMKNPAVERRVYIKADARASWGSVKLVLDAVRAAGVLRIAILADQRRSAAFHI